MPLKVDVSEKQSGIFNISLVGTIDSTTYYDFEKKMDIILDPPPKILVFNMAGVTYISSMGLRVIFKTRKTVEENGGIFIMTDLRPQIKKVFETIKALPGFNVFASVEEADNYLSRIQKKEEQKNK